MKLKSVSRRKKADRKNRAEARSFFKKQLPIIISLAFAGGVIGHEALAEDLTIGLPPGSLESVVLTGSSNYDRVEIGVSGIGFLTLSQNSNLTTIDNYLGYSLDSVGIAAVRGTWIYSGTMVVGYSGTGMLNIEEGGYVSSVSYLTDSLGFETASHGIAIVSGTWSTYALDVGHSGTGTLTIEEGGVVSGSSVVIGSQASSSGTVILNQGGTLVTGSIAKGSGIGSLTFDGGTVRATRNNGTYLSNFAFGDVTIASGGAIFDTNGFDIGFSTALSGSGGLTKSGSGALTLSGSNSYGGGTTVRSGTLVLNGSIFHEEANTVIGGESGDEGTLVINASGVVTNLSGYVGSGSNSVSTVVVSGSWINSGALVIGEHGTATLDIEEGGYVFSSNGGVGYATANVSGTWSNSDLLIVGSSGTGTLNIHNGGYVSGSNVFLGGGHSGTANVSGSWINSGTMLAGIMAPGTLNIEKGGYVFTSEVYLAVLSQATVTVSGSWINSGTMAIGHQNTATLDIKEGGYVFNSDGSLGDATSSTRGTATVSGSWVNSGMMMVGNYGTGALNIESGGMVSGSSVVIGVKSSGTGAIRLNQGGTLVSGIIAKGAGTGTLTFNGGTVRATRNNDTYFSNFAYGNVTIASGGAIFDTNGYEIGVSTALSGSGGVTKSGSGTLNLTGSSNYAGATRVAVGTLAVNGGLYGSGALTVESGATLSGTGVVTGGVTIEDGGILSAGNSPGTLTLGALSLSSSSITNFELGSSSDLVAVTGNLTLDGVLNITGITGFDNDTYTLFTYGGDLVNNYFTLNLVPDGWNLAQFTIDLSVDGAVRLLVDNSVTVQYWDGTNTAANGGPAGGDGVWSNAGTNWTNINGSVNTNWKDAVAVFSGSAGTVSVIDDASFTHLQFETDGYTIEASGGSLLATGTAQIHTETDVGAEIAMGIGQSGTAAIVKTGSGTLTLSGSNRYEGGTTVRGGTLAVNGSISHENANTVVGSVSGENGTLAIGAAGVVADQNGILGSSVNSVGTATVSGTWMNSGTLNVGVAGTGTLNLENGGVVNTGQLAFAEQSGGVGIVNLNSGGTLTTGGLVKGSGTVSLKFDGGTLQATAGGETYFSNFADGDITLAPGGAIIDTNGHAIGVSSGISGTGGLTKSGSGSLALSGSSNYSGGTVIAAGTLETRNLHALGSGDVTLRDDATLKATGGINIGGGLLWDGGTLELTLGTHTDTIYITGALDNQDGGHQFLLSKGTGYDTNFAYTLITFTDSTNFLFSGLSANLIDDVAAKFRLINTGNTVQIIYLDTYTVDSVIELGEGTDRPEVGSIAFTDEGGTVVISSTLSIATGTITSGTGNSTIVDNILFTEEKFQIDNEGSLTITSALATGTSGGGLVKTGSGTLVLLGSNGYTGNTVIEEGTLAVANDINLGVGGDVEFEGGTLQTIGTFAPERDALLGDEGGVIEVLRDQTVTWNGIITDNSANAGGLGKSGSGTLVLTHSNSYTGGTTIDEGTVRAENSSALGNGAVVLNSGGTLDVAIKLEITSFIWNGGGVISLAPQSGHLLVIEGALIKGTPGIFAFDFALDGFDFNTTYTIMTFGSNDGFSLDDFSAPVFFGITPNFFFETDGSLAVRYLGASTGSIIENKGPTFTPTDANFVVSGSVTTGGPEDNNTVNSLLFQNGSTLEVHNRLTVTAGSLTVAGGQAEVHGGEVHTPGDFTKSGPGALVSETDFTVVGEANLEEGALIVNGSLTAGNGVTVSNAALLGGSGVIHGSLTNRGVLSPGNSPGTLTVNGDYVQADHGAFLLEIAGKSNFDRLIVSGMAILSGALNVIPYAGYQLEYGQKFTFIKSSRLRGAFDEINLPSGLRGRILEKNDDATLLIAPESYTQVAQTPNQKKVASALDAYIGADGDRDTVSTALDELRADQYASAFDQIVPSLYESLTNITIEQSNAQGQMLQQRFGAVRFGGIGSRGFSQIGLDLPVVAETSSGKQKETRDIMVISADNPWGVWAQGNGIFGKTSGVNDVRSYDTDSGGFLLGADYRWNDAFTTGIYAGYQGSKSRYDGGGNTTINAARFGGYATLDTGNGFYANGLLGGGFSDYELRRPIEFGSIQRTARSNPNGGEFTAMLGSGYDWRAGGFVFGPVASTQYTYVKIDGFSETGAKSLNLQLTDQEAHSLRTTLGARIAYPIKLKENILLTPEIRASWQHEFLQDGRDLHATLDGGSGPGFNYATTSSARDAFFGGVGFNLQLGNHWSANLYYNLNCASGDFQSQMISGGVNVSF